MKLPEHVDLIRTLIEGAFEKQLARLGIGKTSRREISALPETDRPRRQLFEAMLDNHRDETGDDVKAREKLIDELTFTLFNRLAAIKVMEAARLFPPILTKETEHGDRSFGHKAWLEGNPDQRTNELEGIQDYLSQAFDKLGETLPLYHRSHPYGLLPDAISLNAIIDAFNEVEKDVQVGGDIWQSDDVLGWLYESYNNAKKTLFKDSKEKTEYDKVSLQSQVYTPRWVVQFLIENSLGKLYLEMYPNSAIKRAYKIANAPTIRSREPKPLHEIRLIDPASGSGNFLLYAFDFFYALYLDQIENYGADYDEKEIPRLIIENNLHGIDLDERAIQTAQLGLYIKARKKNRTIGNLKFRIVSSDFYLPDYETVRHIFEEGDKLDKNQKDLIAEIWNDLKFAYKFGSLIPLDAKLRQKLKKLKENQDSSAPDLFATAEIEAHKSFAETFFANLKAAAEQYGSAENNSFLSSKTCDAVTFLEILSREYDVAAANPPYTDSADFGPELATFIEATYKKPHGFHTNLYATFIKRCYDLTGEEGKIALIHPHTFMFIKSFEDVRKFMINKTHIDVLVDFGLDRVNLFGPGILLDATFYVLSKKNNNENGIYFNLTTNLQEKFKKGKFLQALSDFVEDKNNDRVFILEQSKLQIIKSWPFIYWISDEFREKFGDADIATVLSPAQGAATTNNLRFLRFWWEVDASRISECYFKDAKPWVPYAKGGPFEKWYGNNWLVINYSGNGSLLKSVGAVLRNSDLYFKEGVTYSASGSKGASFRLMSKNSIFDTGGSCIFANKEFKDIYYLLGFLNSKLASYILNCLNPTVNAQVGDMQRIPFAIPNQRNQILINRLVKDCVDIKTYISQKQICERGGNAVRCLDSRTAKLIFEEENHLLTQVLINEAIINEKVFEVYELTEYDKSIVLAKEGKSIGGLPVCEDARSAFLAENRTTREFSLDNIRIFIETLPTKVFLDDERQKIENEFPSLYQSNNDLEEFCIRHQINPINVWYWFKRNPVIPNQRAQTLAMEFLTDLICEILIEDDDGVIPLVPNAGEKVLLERLEDKFIEKGFTMAQFSSFDSLLGHPLEEYLNFHFFAELSDHLNLFMHLPKTPFIWHLTSGPEQGFDCYVIIYKWSRDKLMRLKSVYLEHRERSLTNRRADLAENNSAEAQNEKERIGKQLTEIESFKAKINELLTEGYDPILDDGVGKNIAPLQKKKMIPYEVLNPGQLKKYLNADW